MKSKSRCSAVLAGLKGSVEGKIKSIRHPELVSGSSTHDVTQAKQQPTWKIPNQVWNDAMIDNNNNIFIGQVKPDIKKGRNLLDVRVAPDLYSHNGGQRFGFTLIELLVVVLIIGILASIALPQYKKAIIKSRVATILPVLQSIREAEEVYYMANGQYDYANSLDIELPNNCAIWELANGDPNYTVSCGSYFKINIQYGRAAAYYCPDNNTDWFNKYDFVIVYRFAHQTEYPGESNMRLCYGKSALGKEICQNLSGKSSPDIGQSHYSF